MLALFHQTYDFKNNSPGKEILISIPDGATGLEIGKNLESNGVIKSFKYFVDFYLSNDLFLESFFFGLLSWLIIHHSYT